MNASDTKLMKALRGQPTDGVPFWEVWFGMTALAERLLNENSVLSPQSSVLRPAERVKDHDEFGRPTKSIEGAVRLARIMGWEHLSIWTPGHSPGAKTGTTSDGASRYVQGGKVPLEELYARPDPDLTEAAEYLEQAKTVAREEGMATIAYVPWCFHAANTALGLENLAYLLYDDPQYIDALFEWIEEGTRRAIREVILPLGVDIVLFDGDCAYKNGLMVNPDLFRRLVFDRTAKTVAPLKDAGILYTFHSDGKVDDLLPVLIELGFSGFHGVESAANDLEDIKQRFGREITLIGNMDIVFLTHASVEQVRTETEKMLATGMRAGRYIAACNTSPLDYIPFENYMAMVDVIKSYG
ncbi:MAG: uroporphyrinogen decarboxylase family protein [Armatimonadota bacterium]|nr:uroporphyrinogen decarboxylase family protein [Armatimonadota bacterium]